MDPKGIAEFFRGAHCCDVVEELPLTVPSVLVRIGDLTDPCVGLDPELLGGIFRLVGIDGRGGWPGRSEPTTGDERETLHLEPMVHLFTSGMR